MKKAIETIEEVIALIEAEKERISELDASNLALSTKERGNTLPKQNERLLAIDAALSAVSSEETKKALNCEISNLCRSIKNLELIDKQNKVREDHLKKLKCYSEKLFNAVQVYKKKQTIFERSIGAVSGQVMELLKSDDSNLTEEETKQSDELSNTETTFFEPATLEEKEEKVDETPSSAANDETVTDDSYCEFATVDETEKKAPVEAEATFTYSKVKLNPILALAKILRRFENLTSQLDSEKYNKRLYATFKEVAIEESEKEAICEMFDSCTCPGLTDEQSKVIILSIPKEIITALGRKDIIEMRKTAVSEVYTKGFLNTEVRSKFTYKLMKQLGSIILSDVENKELKIKVLFNENSDKIIKNKYGKETPDYRAFAVIREQDLLNY